MGAPNSAPKAVPAAAISRGAKFRRTRDHAAFQHRTATLLPSPRALNTAPRRSRGTSGVRPRFGRRCPRSAQAQTALHPRSSSPALCQAGADLPGAPGGRLIAEESGAGPAASSPACSAPLLSHSAAVPARGSSEPPSAPAAPLRCAPLPQAELAAARGWHTARRRTRRESNRLSISRGTELLPGLLSPLGPAASSPRHFRGSGTEPSVSRGGARHRPAPPPAPCAAAPAPHRCSPLLTAAARAAVSDNFPPSAGRAPTATSGLAPPPPRRVRGRAQRRTPGPRLMRGSSLCAEGGGTAGQGNSKGIVLEKKFSS